MLDIRGQASGGMIKTIFVGIILAVVLGMATSNIIASMPTSTSHTVEINDAGVENFDLGNYREVDNATITVDYDYLSGDNVKDNFTVLLNSAVIVDKDNVEGTGTIENDVASHLETGTNTLEVTTEGDNYNSLKTTLDASVNMDSLGVLDTVKAMGPTIVTFIFLGLLVLAIVGLIRYFRAI